MKKNCFLILGLISILFACKSKEQKLIEQLTPVVTDIVKRDSLVDKIDSLIIWKVDTLSDAKYTERHILNQYNKIDYYLALCKSFSKQAELEGSQAKLNQQQAKIYGGILESATLQQIATDDASDNIKDFKEHFGKSQLYLDSAKKLRIEVDELDSKLKANKINNKNFRGYLVHFKLLGSDKKNLEVRKDSMSTYISPSLRVIQLSTM